MAGQTRETLTIVKIAMYMFLAITLAIIASRQPDAVVILLFLLMSFLWCLGAALQISKLVLRANAANLDYLFAHLEDL